VNNNNNNNNNNNQLGTKELQVRAGRTNAKPPNTSSRNNNSNSKNIFGWSSA
jgi:hypothetical protein